MNNRKSGLVLGLVLGLLLDGYMVTSASANEKTVTAKTGQFKNSVIELYTSEGCSSCPPADKWLTQLGTTIDDNFRVIPLAFHVTYWNYLGWEDPFSNDAYTKRQRHLSNLNDNRTMYTPEFFVDSKETRGGSNIINTIKQQNQEKAEVTIEVSSTLNHLDLMTVLDIENRIDDIDIQANWAIYENRLSRDIDAGENRGRTLKHNYVVRHWSEAMSVELGDNQQEVHFTIPDSWEQGNLGLAVVVSNVETGETLQALNTPLSALF